MSEHRHWDPNVGMDIVRFDPNEGMCGRCGTPLDSSGRCSKNSCPYHELEAGQAYFVG